MKKAFAALSLAFFGLYPSFALAQTAARAPSAQVLDDNSNFPIRPITLDEAYRLTIKRSETFAESKEAVKSALGQVEQLISALLPHVSFGATQFLQESPNIPGLSFIDITNYRQEAFSANQTIFDGFREYLAYKVGKLGVRSAKLAKKRAESLLYQSVAQAYTNLLMYQKQIKIQKDTIVTMQNQVDFLKYWKRIGRARDSDVLSAASQLAQFKSQLELTRGQEAVSQELMRFLTGDDAEFIPQEISLPSLPERQPFLARADHREDVEAARANFESAQAQTSIYRRSRLPTVTAGGDYFLNNVPFSANTHYDGNFNLSFPIFDGGLISGQIKQSKAQEKSAKQALSLAERTARNDVNTAYSTLHWTLRAVNALDKTATLAAQNVEAEKSDYKKGLVTNLDVLTSITTLLNDRMVLNQNQQQAIYAAVQLEVAAGGPSDKEKEVRQALGETQGKAKQ